MNNEHDQTQVDDQPLVEDSACVICCKGSNLKDVSETLADNLATNLEKFNDKNIWDPKNDVNERLKEVLNSGTENLKRELKRRNYEVHKSCYDKFNKSHFERATLAKKRKSGESSITTTRSKCPTPAERFVEQCMYCGELAKDDPKHPERSNPLHAAASLKKDSSYVNEFTNRTREMATELGDIKVLNVLGNDVRSSELYYTNGCNVTFKRRYDDAIKEKMKGNGDSVLDDFAAVTAVKDFINYVDDDSFDLRYLETIYMEELRKRGRVIGLHITRFASHLTNSDIGLTIVQSQDGGK